MVVTYGWIKVLRTQKLCSEASPLKEITISSHNPQYNFYRVSKCLEEANKPENSKANFIVVLWRNDENGNNCFLYEKCDEKDLKRRLPGVSFQKKRSNIYSNL